MTRPFQERIPSKIGMWLYQLRLYWHNFLLIKIPHEKSSHKGETLQIPLVVIVLLRMHKHVRSYLHAQNVTAYSNASHQRHHKILNRGNPYKCNKCEYTCSHPWSMKVHMRTQRNTNHVKYLWSRSLYRTPSCGFITDSYPWLGYE